MKELPETVVQILDRLRSRGFEAYAVGGCVRDLLLGRTPEDYDVASNASPAQIKETFHECKTVDTGILYGTVRVAVGGGFTEITSYRRDGAYSDGRRPDAVVFTPSLAEDLARRDFTINAMAYAPGSGLMDLCGGREDLAAGVIRAVGDPEARFREDALRILRALRFASCLGFSLEERTAAAVLRCAGLLEKISGERIYSELTRLLCGKNCESVLRAYHEVFAVLIPEIEQCRGFEQHTKYHNRDVYEHTLAAVSAAAPNPSLRLAMLLHDLAKPRYFTLSPDGVGHFKGHAAGSVQIAERLLKRLKPDSKTSERILALVKYHDIVIEDRPALLKRYLNRFGAELLDEIIQAHIADDSAKAPEYRSRIAGYEKARRTVREILASRQCFQLRDLKIGGNDLLELGLSGRAVGETLRQLLDDVIDGKCANEREPLLTAAKKYNSGQEDSAGV